MIQELVQEVTALVEDLINGIHTALPGKILDYDPATNEATVLPSAVYNRPDGELLKFPSISGVPLVFPQSGGTSIAWPVKNGDGCLLIFSEEDLEYWLSERESGAKLKFDLSNAVAITGLIPGGNDTAQRANNENAVIVKNGETVLKVAADSVTVEGSLRVTGTITADGEIQGGTPGA